MRPTQARIAETQLVSMMLDANDDEHYYLQDANFNVTAVVDDNGTVEERYAYTPYWEVSILASDFSSLTSSAIDNEYLYTGRRLAPETGLQLNRNRFYASHLGRWINRDPMEYDAGLWNLYNYLNSNPLTGLDPSGLEAETREECFADCEAEFTSCTQLSTAACAACLGLCFKYYCWTPWSCFACVSACGLLCAGLHVNCHYVRGRCMDRCREKFPIECPAPTPTPPPGGKPPIVA